MKDDPIEKRFELMRLAFEDELKHRAKALKRELSMDNLGADIVDRGARKLMDKHGVDQKSLEFINVELSKALAKRIKTLDDETAMMPERAREIRRRLMRQMQHDATVKDDPIVPGPAQAIFGGEVGECDDDHCRVEISTDLDLGRAYPLLIVTGEGNNRMRSGEVWLAFLWSFTPDRSGRYLIEPMTEFHGRYVSTREYHCYANTDGSRRNFEVYGSHSQPGLGGDLPIYGRMSMRLPSTHDRRYDDAISGEYYCTLDAGAPAHVMFALRFQCFARSRFATVGYDFAGEPRSDNFVGMPWLRYTFLG